MKKWVKVERPSTVARESAEFVRFLCKYAGFQASKNDDNRIPYKLVKYGLDWALVLLNGRPIYVPSNLTEPCRAREPKKVVEEVWEGNF